MSPKRTEKKKKGLITDRVVIKNNSAQSAELTEKVILLVMLVAVGLLLTIGPFERGLFFTRELLSAQVLIFSLLIIWGLFRVLRKDNRLIESPLDICLLILFAAYTASFFVAVDKRTALEEIMKIAAYLVVYLVVIDLCRYWFVLYRKTQLSNEDKAYGSSIPPGLNTILHLLMGVATVVAIASLLAPIIDWIYLGTYTDNRIGSPMGYANTAAAYMMASYFLTLSLFPLAKRRFRLFYLVPAVLMLIGIVLTFSRGAWLMMLPLVLLYILASSTQVRLRAFLYMLVTSLVGVPVAFMIDHVYRSATPVGALLLLVAAIAVVIGFGFLAEVYMSQKRKKRIFLAVSIAVTTIAILLFIIIKTLFSPLYLQTAPDEQPRRKTIEQVIDQIEAEQEYLLTFEVNAGQQIDLPEDQLPGYVWGVRVLEVFAEYQIELLDYRAGITDGWEEKTFPIQTSKGAERLEVHFFNRDPGTYISARSVLLSSPEEELQLHFLFSRILPERFYDRLFSYTRDANIGLRLEFSRDALKIVRDYPLLGIGGGGWAALYYGYQDQEYHSRAVHNHFLEVWIEAGIFGFLAFAGIWISFLVAFIFNCLRRKVSPMVRQFWTALLLPVVALGLHSTIDWNFSLPAMGIFLFVLLGAGRSLDQVQWFNSKRKKETAKTGIQWLTGLAAMVIGILLLAYTIVLISGSRATVLSQELLEKNIIKQATIELEKAIALDSFRAVNYHNLNVILEEQLQRTNNPDLIPDILFLAQRAYELEPYNPTYFLRYGELLIRYVNIEEGLSYIDIIIEVRPYFAESYREYALPRVGLAEFFINNDLPAEADKFLDEVFAIELLMQERIGRTEELYFFLGKAYFLREEYSKAFNYFMGVDENDRHYEQAQAHMEMIKEM